MSAKELIVEQQNESLFITLHRPEKRNALSLLLVRELLNLLQPKNIADHTKVIIFQSKGPTFCSGLDLKEIGKVLYEETAQLFQLIYHLPYVTICAIQGSAYAGGLGFLGACDLAIATNEATFCLPEVKIGLIPALVVSLLRRQIAERHIRELSLTGIPINAERAKEIGLINKISSSENFSSELSSYINELSKNSFSALSHLKKLLREFEVPTLAEEFPTCLEMGQKLLLSAETQKHINSFLKKEQK